MSAREHVCHRYLRSCTIHIGLLVLLVSYFGGFRSALAQTAAPQTATPQTATPQRAADKNPAEMSSHDTPATFKAKVNLVLVPVVVRDSQGEAIGNLRQEDFQLFDKGKPQLISKFSVEKSAGQALGEKPSADGNSAEKTTG